MVFGILSHITSWFFRFALWLRRPEVLIFAPAVALCAFWVLGEQSLILLALVLPLIVALTWHRGATTEPARLPDVLEGLSLRSQIVGTLDKILQDSPITGRNSACFVLQFDDSDRLVTRFGRSAQVEVLARSAERICSVLRTGDVVARLEGGGFAVALAPVRRLDLEALIQVATRLQSAVSVPVNIDASKLYVTCSIGFCHSAQAPDLSGATLLNAAQIAADEARRRGPNAIRAYSQDMARTRADRDSLRADLEIALEQGQIRPHFQPQTATVSGAITGFEALARWYHPQKGLIPPAEFLPLIEDAGLEDRLGEVILYHALMALAAWDKAGLHIPTVAVNFSAQELRNPRLAERLKWELDRFDLEPKRLTVEVLETVVAETENDVVVANIAGLSRLGCGIDLDDFGTGHASITSLRRFAVRRIKIDRSFITRLDIDPDQQKMVSAILSMADQLGLATLAEGVETPGERAMLTQLGCVDIQGFGIARPMPLDETMDWIPRYRGQLSNVKKLAVQI
jgi:diguanylate cyclase